MGTVGALPEITETAEAQISRLFADALSTFRSNVAPDVIEGFQGVSSIEDLNSAIKDIEKDQANRRSLRNLAKIRPLLNTLDTYSKVIEVFVNAKPEILAFIWGPIKLCLQVTSNVVSAFDALLEAYGKLADSLPIITAIEQLYSSSELVRKVLLDVYHDILTFHLRALHIFKKKGWQIVLKLIVNKFEGHFGDVLKNLQRSKQLLMSLADIAHFKESQRHFHESQEDRLKTQEEYQKRKESEEKERIFTVLDWLSPLNQSNHHHEIQRQREKFGQTTQWLFAEHSWRDLIREERRESGLFWLSGIPGAGKTFLFNAAIDEIGKARRSDLTIGVAYFYCKYDDPLRSNFDEICKSIIGQLLKDNQNCLEYLYDFALKSCERNAATRNAFQEILRAMLSCYDQVFIGIDGMDECERAERTNLMSLLHSLILPSDQDTIVRVLIFGCAEYDIARSLSSCQRLDVKSHHLSGSIGSYVNTRLHALNTIFKFKTPRLEEIARKIILQSAGMFLLSRLILDMLEDTGSREDVQEELENDQLPQGINQAYGRIIARLQNMRSTRNQQRAKLVLEVVVAARRPLKLHEIQGILSIRLDNKSIDIETRRYLHHLKELCGPIIEVTDDGTVELVHTTARKYLDENHSGFLETYLASYRLTDICVGYLTFECFDPNLDEATIIDAVQRGDYAFQDYAISNWIPHVQMLRQQPPRPTTCIENFLGLWHQVLASRYWNMEVEEENHALNKVEWESLNRAKDACHSYSVDGPSNKEMTPAILNLIMRTRSLIEAQVGSETAGDQQEFIRDAYGSSCFKCPIFACPDFQQGFPSRRQRDSHVQKQHVKPFKCTHVDCAFYSRGLGTRAALDNHLSWAHDAATLPFRFPKLKPQSIWKSLEEAIDCDNATLVQTLCAGVSEASAKKSFVLQAVKHGSFRSAQVLVDHPPFLRNLSRGDTSTIKRILSITSQAGEQKLMQKILSILDVENVDYNVLNAVWDFPVSEDNVEAAQFMLDNCGNQGTFYWPGILSKAVESDCHGIIDLFLEIANRLGLDCRTFESAAHAAVKKDHHSLARKLLEAGCQDGAKGHFSQSLRKKQAEGLDEMVKFVSQKTSGTIRDSSKGTTWGNALQDAAHKGDNDRIKALLQEGADINHTKSKRGTAIRAASQRGHAETVKLLLDNGADTTIYSENRLGVAFGYRNGQHVLIEAARHGHNDVVSVLLEGDINSSVHLRSPSEAGEVTRDWTPLHFAADRGHLEVMRTLLTWGADPDAKSKDLITPLHLAARAVGRSKERASQKTNLKSQNETQSDVVSLLLMHCADATARDLEGNTALHRIFLEAGYDHWGYGEIDIGIAVNVAKLLTQAGADLQTQNHNHQTPREVALSNSGKDMTRRKEAIDIIDPKPAEIHDRRSFSDSMPP